MSRYGIDWKKKLKVSVSVLNMNSLKPQKMGDTIAENQKLQSETTDLRLKNSELRLEYYENVDKLTDKQKEIEEAERLKKELLEAVNGDDYLKE